MRMLQLLLPALLLAGLFPVRSGLAQQSAPAVVSYTADPASGNLRFYWRDGQGKNFGSIARLKTWLEGRKKRLAFAMNGGMYLEDGAPLGLYIEDGKVRKPLNLRSGTGNFYLMPNGVLYITKEGRAGICKSSALPPVAGLKWATQSGPLLLVDGQPHPAFTAGSANLNIRNGVGLLPDGRLLFAMSKGPVNFYDFAQYFRNAGCRWALYLDGAISQCYQPAQGWIQTGGNFGVIIAVAE